MFVSTDTLQFRDGKPLFDFLFVVVVALGGGQDVEGVIELHIEWEVGVIGERKLFGIIFEPNHFEKLSKEVDEMNNATRNIAQLEEQGFGEVTEDGADRLIEVECSGVVTTVVDPDKHLASSLQDFG